MAKRKFPRNSESAKLDYKPVTQWGKDGVDSYLTRPRKGNPVKNDMYEGPEPEAWKHLGKKA